MYPIDYTSQVCLLGSCFVEHIGQKLNTLKFKSLTNPYGILFHPLAIEKTLRDIIHQKQYQKKELVLDQGVWHSPHHHSQFSHPEAQVVLDTINSHIKNSFSFLKTASHVVLTLGTSWVYHHIETDQLVANCHKIPQKQFLKRLLSVTEIVQSLQKTITMLRELNPEMQILFTVSPVRHLKDQMQQNTRSKAHLLTAIYEVLDAKNTFYFPSYEILMDDLRDYRFYNADMLHPNEIAVDYVWNLFQKTWMAEKAQTLATQIAQIQTDLNHRPFHPTSEKHQQFLKNIDVRKKQLEDDFGIEW